MKKSPITPGIIVPDQIIEPDSDWEIPTYPIRIFTALNGTGFLASGSDDEEVRIWSDNSMVFKLWTITGFLPVVEIKCFPFELYLTATNEGKIIAAPYTDSPYQRWALEYAGGNKVRIGVNRYDGQFLHALSGSDGGRLALVDRAVGMNQVFQLGANNSE